MNCIIILANIISLLHFIIVIAIISIPFLYTIPAIYFLHAFFCLSVILHWIYNNDICSLSIIESHLRGVSYTQSYTHKIISPIYSLPKEKWTKICYLILIGLLIISIIRIINSKNLELAKIYYIIHKNKILRKKRKKNLSLLEKVRLLKKCIPFMITNKYNNF